MRTRTIRVGSGEAAHDRAAIAEAAGVLRRGGLVAFPTETVYGLGADALDARAVARIFAAKGRPAWDPLIVHVGSRAMLDRVAASLPPGFDAIAARFMPGPLTVLVPRARAVPDEVTAGRESVAVRIPSHPVALALIESAGTPIAAPSANRFGHASPTTAAHVLADLDGRIDLVLDAGPTSVGVESTVVDLSRTPPLVLRPGGVSREDLERVLGPVELYRLPLVAVPPEALPSPGAGIRHYAPRARVVVVDAPARLGDLVRELAAEGLRVGALVPVGLPAASTSGWASVEAVPWGRWGDWDSMASTLFAGLRQLDAGGLDVIACPLPPAEGLGLALRDRLEKAARPAPDERAAPPKVD